MIRPLTIFDHESKPESLEEKLKRFDRNTTESEKFGVFFECIYEAHAQLRRTVDIRFTGYRVYILWKDLMSVEDPIDRLAAMKRLVEFETRFFGPRQSGGPFGTH